jgi:putative resolvase
MTHRLWVPTSEAMQMYGVTSSTLRRWAQQSKIEYIQTSGGRYRYLKLDTSEVKIPSPRVTCIYARVSANKQKDDLDRQVNHLKSKYSSSNVYFDIASSLNFKRHAFNKLLTLICNQKVDTVVCTHKDRIARFGFEMFEWICKFHGTKIVIDSLDGLPLSFEHELTEDLLSVTHHFSGQMYAIRSHSKKYSNVQNKK